MGYLENGQWQSEGLFQSDKKGAYVRQSSVFRRHLSRDGSTPFSAEANRYHLYISYACPWASRTLIMRELKGLQKVISYSTVEAEMLDKGWQFANKSRDEAYDPIMHKQYLYQVYLCAATDYAGKVTVPVLWDKQLKTIVNNESADIMRILNADFADLAQSSVDYYPSTLQADIDRINADVYENINNGVYRCGFATTQSAYDEAAHNLFAALDRMEKILAQQPYLLGTQITEADWRLFVTLIRFDVVYVGHFKCNIRRIADYPNLSNYCRALYQWPGIAQTVRFDHIKTHYYASHKLLNPLRIVPLGPDIDFNVTHNRTRFAQKA